MSNIDTVLSEMATEALSRSYNISTKLVLDGLSDTLNICKPSNNYLSVFCYYESRIAHVNTVTIRLQELLKDVIVSIAYDNNKSSLLLHSDVFQLTLLEMLPFIDDNACVGLYDKINSIMISDINISIESAAEWVKCLGSIIDWITPFISNTLRNTDGQHNTICNFVKAKLNDKYEELNKKLKLNISHIEHTLNVKYVLDTQDKNILNQIYNDLLTQFCIDDCIGYGADDYQRQVCIAKFNWHLLSVCGYSVGYSQATGFITQLLTVKGVFSNKLGLDVNNGVIKCISYSLNLIKEIMIFRVGAKNSYQESEEITYSV